MSSVVISGDTSGTITLAAPTVAGTNTITLPANTGTMVTTASSAVVTPTMLSQPLTSGTAQASTSGTSIDFTSIPSWVKRITVMLNGVSTNSTSYILVQVGSGTISTSGYAGTCTSGASIATNSTAGFIIVYNITAAALTSGQVVLTTLGNNIWVESGVTAAPTLAGNYSAGSVTLSGALDRVRITTVNGTDTFDAGSINILYE
jgi:hypothetical protein